MDSVNLEEVLALELGRQRLSDDSTMKHVVIAADRYDVCKTGFEARCYLDCSILHLCRQD